MKRYMKKYFCRQLPVNRFLAKTQRVKQNCHEKLFQKSILGLVFLFKINITQYKWYEKLGRHPC